MIALNKRTANRIKKSYPFWTYRTFREFQLRKRADLRYARIAIEQLRNGISLVPGGNVHFGPLVSHFEALEELARPRNWK